MNASECRPPHTSTRFFGRSGNRYGSVIVLCKSPHERSRVAFLGRMLRMSGLFNELEGVRTYLPVYCLALAEIQYRCYETPNPKLLAMATARASRLGSLESVRLNWQAARTALQRSPVIAGSPDCLLARMEHDLRISAPINNSWRKRARRSRGSALTDAKKEISALEASTMPRRPCVPSAPRWRQHDPCLRTKLDLREA